MSETPYTDPLIGTEFVGRYRIDAMLGRGGMGSVYRATQLGIGRPVALKVLNPEVAKDERVVRRFENEAKTIANLHHPNIIGLHDFGKDADGHLFLVMEFVEGEPLSSMLRREAPLPAPRAVHILRQVLEALVEAHAAGVVHRDLKPENLFVMAAGGRRKDTIKVLDFGIAKIAPEVESETKQVGQITATGIVIGSALYMAPEQARAEPVSPKTDLYSLGAIIYEMLAGRPMFDARGLTQLLVAHVMETPKPIVNESGQLAGPLIDLMFKCLEKDPAARPAGADAMIAALDGMSRDYVRLVTPGTPTNNNVARPDYDKLSSLATTGMATRVEGATPKKKSMLPWLGGGMALVAALVLAVVLSASGRRPHEQQLAQADSPPPAAAKQEAKPEPVAVATTPPPKEEVKVAAKVDPPPEVKPEPKPEPKPEVKVEPPTQPTIVTVAAPKTLTVVVDSDPRGARVWLGDKDLGAAPVAVTWLDNEAPPTVTLKRGTLTKDLALVLADAGTTKTVPLAVKKKPTTTEQPGDKPQFKMIE